MTLQQAAQMALKYFEDAYGLEDAEIEIREALRQALSPVKTYSGGVPNYCAEPEQDPVAWMFQHSETGNVTFLDNLTMAKLFGKTNVRWGEAIPLYTAPSKREWVGLTDDEVMDIYVDTMAYDAVRVAEAKLKDKNGY